MHIETLSEEEVMQWGIIQCRACKGKGRVNMRRDELVHYKSGSPDRYELWHDETCAGCGGTGLLKVDSLKPVREGDDEV